MLRRTPPVCWISLGALALIISACGGVSQDKHAALVRQTAVTAAEAQRAQLIAALEPLDPLRYHELDAIIRNEGRIPTDAIIWAERARQTLHWLDWPAELRGHVDQYGEWLDSLLRALRTNDASAADEPSRIVHALAHTFEASLEAWLDGAAVPAPPALAGLEPPTHRHSVEDGAGAEAGQVDEQEHDTHNE